MNNVAGVRLDPTGRTIEVEAGELTLRRGDVVVVDLRPHSEIATVSVDSGARTARTIAGRVLRLAGAQDLERVAAETTKLAVALSFARERAFAHGLPIKVFRVEMPRGANRAMFYFSSDKPVDFRELARELAARYQTRIELRQLGVRDEAKMVGGIGSCGRELCCTTFLPHFAPVSIKMAKNQNLALHPSRVSGQCGRLKCCLVYEDADYVAAARLLGG